MRNNQFSPPVYDPEPVSGGEKGSVLVIGAAGMDFVGRLKGDLADGTSNPALIRTSFGGVARNVAENLARLGQPATLLTVVGGDDTGNQLLQHAASTGVDVSSTLVISTEPTASYLAVLNPGGELRFALDDMHILSTLTPAYIREQECLFREASMVFVDANLPAKTLRSVFAGAKRARLPVCADPTSASLTQRLVPFLPGLFLITPNAAEAGILCGCEFNRTSRRGALKAAKALVSLGVQIAIITLGEHGVCYATSETSGMIPALHIEVVDPTGAGDALTAAVMFALLNDIPLDDAVRLGVSAASLTLNHRGAVVPDLSLERLYDRLVI